MHHPILENLFAITAACVVAVATGGTAVTMFVGLMSPLT